MSHSDYELLVAFDRDEPEFARGVEIGMLYERLLRDPEPVVAQIHADNAEMALRVGESLGLRVRARDLNDDWLEVTYEGSRTPSPG